MKIGIFSLVRRVIPQVFKKNRWNKSATGSKSLQNVACKELEHKDTNVDLKISL